MTYINDVAKHDIHVHDVLITVENIKKKDLMKLHHLYGHVAAEQLERFLVKVGKSPEVTRRVL